MVLAVDTTVGNTRQSWMAELRQGRATAQPGRVGQLIGGRYELLALLGMGGMGAVYAARHTITRRSVALKLISSSMIKDRPVTEQRLLREASVVGSIQHPGVVEILDAGREPDGSIYLVFELLDGEDLERAMAGGRCRPRDLVATVVRALDALAAVHLAGYIHRDLKPANIYLVGGAPRPTGVKLIDFGIARPIGAGRTALARVSPPGGAGLTEHGTIVGTVEYMSPEQALGDPIDARSDLWSAGAVLFRGLTGRPPFIASNHHRLIVKAATETAPMLHSLRPDLPGDLCHVVDVALSRDPDERWPDASSMARALDRACSSRLDRCAAPRAAASGALSWATDTGELAADVR